MKYNLLFCVLISLSASGQSDNKEQTIKCFLREVTTEQIEKHMKRWLDAYDLKPTETIASIGVGSGWRELEYSVVVDSVTFYLLDIDTTCLNQKEIKRGIEHYSKIKGRPIENKFIPVVSTEKTTNLSPNSVDKVLITNSFHHFTYPDEMISDIHTILKEKGKLCISEYVVKKTGQTLKGVCSETHSYKSETDFITDIEKNGFGIMKVDRDKKHRIFVFERN